MVKSNILALALVALSLVTVRVGAEELAEDCLLAREVRSMEILDERTLILKGTADRFWLSRLEPRCAGLRKNMQLTIHRFGSQLCANDRFEARHRIGLDLGATSSCRFGTFEPVAEGQVVLLKETLEAS